MKLADYRIGFLLDEYRHIALGSTRKSLCRVYSDFYSYLDLDEIARIYPDYYLSMCPKCFKKLPIKVQTEIKFRYMVYKLKK